MADSAQDMNQEAFDQFNKNREALAQQFQDLVEIVGNHVFNGSVDGEKENLLEEINRQKDLVEAEKNLLRNLYYYASNLRESKFMVGVFGRFKAGKSTLLNTLAGENISPMDTRISTGVLNFTYLADEEECTIYYDSGETKKIDPEKKAHYIDFRTNPDNEMGIHSVRHGCPGLRLQKEIVFVDTPGLEAVNNIHEKITLDFITQCHIAIVVSTYPPFGEGELRFYQQIQKAIPNTFLVQNLPADKLGDWVPLEAQTLESLNKLEFYEQNKEKYSQDLTTVLRKIGDQRDEKALSAFKEAHGLNVHSLNAAAGYQLLLSREEKDLTDTEREKLAESRFDVFKKDLYTFLTDQRGRKLLESYLQKGRLILAELMNMIQNKQEILEQSLEEIEKRIKDEQELQQRTSKFVEMTANNTALKILESYKALKNRVMEKDFDAVLTPVFKRLSEKNIYRLNKEELSEIKMKVGEFNRILGQGYQKFNQDLLVVVEEAQETISAELKNHALFTSIAVRSTSSAVGVQDIPGAGHLDRGFDFAFHGGITFFFASVSGGTGWSLLTTPIGALGVAAGSAPFVALLVGGAIGLGLSFPLAKKMEPFLDKCKELIGKFYHRPTQVVFDDFRARVRAKLDDIEATTVDKLVESFKDQVTQSAENFFEMANKILEDLRDKKENGVEQAESAKLAEILKQLEAISINLDPMKQDDKKMKNVLKGIKGFIGKFT